MVHEAAIVDLEDQHIRVAVQRVGVAGEKFPEMRRRAFQKRPMDQPVERGFQVPDQAPALDGLRGEDPHPLDIALSHVGIYEKHDEGLAFSMADGQMKLVFPEWSCGDRLVNFFDPLN
jgi:hypothetical protein